MILPNFCLNARIQLADSTELTPCLSLFAMNPKDIPEDNWEMVQGVLVDGYTRRLFDVKTRFTRNGPIVTGVIIMNMDTVLFKQVQSEYLARNQEGAEDQGETKVEPELADLVDKIKLGL